MTKPLSLLLALWVACCVAPSTATSPRPQGEPSQDDLPLATGVTLFEVAGLNNPQTIEGTVVAGIDSKPQLKAFGFVAVNYSIIEGERRSVTVSAETADRARLESTPFGDGYRIEGSGPVWVDVEVRYSRTITVDDQEVEVITRIESDEIQFVIESTAGPDPPQPTPEPEPEGESPFAGDGLRCLMVYERDELGSYPLEQSAVLFSAPLRKWMNGNCEEYRILDKDAEQAGNQSQIWVDALARPRESLPWIVVGNGKMGYEGPLPADVDATKALLEQYK